MLPSNSEYLILANLVLILSLPAVNSYFDVVSTDSCYSMKPSQLEVDDQTLLPPIYCNTEQCNGLSLTVTCDGRSDGHYSCDEEHQGVYLYGRAFLMSWNFALPLMQSLWPLTGALSVT